MPIDDVAKPPRDVPCVGVRNCIRAAHAQTCIRRTASVLSLVVSVARHSGSRVVGAL